MTMSGKVGVVLGPLLRASTYRYAVYLLLGGVVLLPYVLLGVAFAGLLTAPEPSRALSVLLLAVTIPIVVLPAFLRATRAMQIVAARALLGVDLPDPSPAAETGRAGQETRLRSALWYALHLLVGGAVGFGLLVAVPMAATFIGRQFGLDAGDLTGVRIGPLDPDDTLALSLVGFGLLVGMVYAIAGLGAMAALMAPALLGPSPAERIAALEAEAGQLAERNRLARELHDSVGHALTVTTLQAGAARKLLGADPEFVGRALEAIEETGRAAMNDLDHVLGLLRQQDGAQPPKTPQPTLAELDGLVADARAGGLEVGLDVAGELEELPAAVSREGYRIVQEALTNVVRHAGAVPVSLRVDLGDRWLDIRVVNQLRGGDGEGPQEGGRGLAGMAERVALLGGRMTAGPDGGEWRVAVRLPTGGGRGWRLGRRRP